MPASGDSPQFRSTVRVALLALAALLFGYALLDHPLYGGAPGFGWSEIAISCAAATLAVAAFLPVRIGGPVLLLGVTSLVMLGVTELAAEMLLGPRHRPIYQSDERVIFKFIPGRRSVMTHAPVNGGQSVAHRINSQGFRGEELRSTREGPRVMVYGDSFIHAYYTPEEQTFVAQLGARLAAGLGRPVEAVNAGVSSYGPDQVSLKMEEELGRLRPDLVVVAVFAGNDYGDLLRNKLFRLAGDGTLVPNAWTLDPNVRIWLERSQRESILLRAIRSARGAAPGATQRASDVGKLDFLLAEAEREYRSYVVERNNVVTNTHVDFYSADVSAAPDSASARYKIAFMQAVLRRIRDVAAKAGIPLAFVFIPHPSDVTPGQQWHPHVDAARFPRYDGRNQTAPLEAAARDLGVPHVSLYDLFRARGAAEVYLQGGDDHWNAAGQALAAAAAADLILRSRLLRAPGH
ncbi:MAG TPA: SGNH/GDSL hydrolase family protein [Burkholderiales bacterium]|nr:SGNH/GDSL hydrolase family protein [Burkholderiales bacterium]